MNASTIVTIGFAALALAGCETLSGPQAFANAEAQREECKAVTLSSASQELRLQNQRGTDGTAMQQTEGKLDLGNSRLNQNPALRSRIAPEQSLPQRVLRDC